MRRRDWMVPGLLLAALPVLAGCLVAPDTVKYTCEASCVSMVNSCDEGAEIVLSNPSFFNASPADRASIQPTIVVDQGLAVAVVRYLAETNNNDLVECGDEWVPTSAEDCRELCEGSSSANLFFAYTGPAPTADANCGDALENHLVSAVEEHLSVCGGIVGGGGDTDSDGVVDGEDNCIRVPNPRQNNQDGDAFGDSCDNCLFVAQNDQADKDFDGIGDACQGDSNATCSIGDGEDGRLFPSEACLGDDQCLSGFCLEDLSGLDLCEDDEDNSCICEDGFCLETVEACRRSCGRMGGEYCFGDSDLEDFIRQFRVSCTAACGLYGAVLKNERNGPEIVQKLRENNVPCSDTPICKDIGLSGIIQLAALGMGEESCASYEESFGQFLNENVPFAGCMPNFPLETINLEPSEDGICEQLRQMESDR